MAAAIDQVRNLALFLDKKTGVQGEVIDLSYKPIENFYRLRVDDLSFGSRSLRVFFWPHCLSRTIWVTGLMWRDQGYKKHMIERQRGRIRELGKQ